MTLAMVSVFWDMARVEFRVFYDTANSRNIESNGRMTHE